MEENITITKKEYNDLIAKSHGFNLQVECFRQLREEIIPTEKDLCLPWYEMLSKCIKNRQLK